MILLTKLNRPQNDRMARAWKGWGGGQQIQSIDGWRCTATPWHRLCYPWHRCHPLLMVDWWWIADHCVGPTTLRVTALRCKSIQISFTSTALVTSAWEFALCFLKSWPYFSGMYSFVHACSWFQGDDHLPLLLASFRSSPSPSPHITSHLLIPLSGKRGTRY